MTLPTRPESAGIPQRYYSEKQLAIYAGFSVRTLQSWRLRSQGPPFRKLCGAVKYDIQAFDAWVLSCPGGGAERN